MKILRLIEKWLEHCEEQRDYFEDEGEDDTAEKWADDVTEARIVLDGLRREIEYVRDGMARESEGDISIEHLRDKVASLLAIL